MTPTITVKEKSTPLLQLEPKNMWTMFYRHGPTPFAFKNFYFKGIEKEARERAQRHCQVMGYKLIMIKSMMPDIDAEENIQLGVKQESE